MDDRSLFRPLNRSLFRPLHEEAQERRREGMDCINRVPSYRDYMDDIPAGFGVINILPLGNNHDDDRW